MYLGKIVEIRDVDFLYNDPKHPYTQVLISSVPEPDPDKKIDGEALTGELDQLIHQMDVTSLQDVLLQMIDVKR